MKTREQSSMKMTSLPSEQLSRSQHGNFILCQILFGFKPAMLSHPAKSAEMSQKSHSLGTAEDCVTGPKVMRGGLERSTSFLPCSDFRNQPWKRGTMVQKEGSQSNNHLILNDC